MDCTHFRSRILLGSLSTTDLKIGDMHLEQESEGEGERISIDTACSQAATDLEKRV